MAVDEIVAAGRVSDTSQTRRFDVVMGDLADHFDPGVFSKRIQELKAHLGSRPDRRLRIRLFMYESFGQELQHRFDRVSSQQYLDMMREAQILGDEQILSELYAKYAEHKSPAKNTLYYLLKAIEIRERIGIQHFSSVSYDYYTASAWLYEVTDYRASAGYGVKSVKYFQNPRDFLFQYVLALDITGAAYLRLNRPDSAMIYYQKLTHELDELVTNPLRRRKSTLSAEGADLWRGIALGGIGQALALQGRYDSAGALLERDLQASVRHQEWTNAALAQNILAQIDYHKKNYRQALARYRQARTWALPGKKLTVLIPAIQGVSAAFAALHQGDSAYVYQQEYLQWKDTLQQRVDDNRLDFTKAQVEYEHMQAVFAKTEKEIARQRQLRNLILAGIAVLTVIVLLLYSRSRLRQKLRAEQLERDKQQAQADAAYARQQVAHAQQQLEEFLRHMAEKNKLIEGLEAQLSGEVAQDVHTRLQNFTILTDDDWSNFKQLFNQAYPGFHTAVIQALPGLSPAELRFLSLYKLNLTQREMAAMLGVSEEAVRKQNYRLRKKLEATHPDTELQDFVAAFN